MDANAHISERELEKLVFGGEEEILDELTTAAVSRKRKKAKHLDVNSVTQPNESDIAANLQQNTSKRKPAWEDADDEKITVKERISTYDRCHRSVAQKESEKYIDFAREKFVQLTGNPDWANLDKKGNTADSDEDSEEELLQKTGNFIVKSGSLPKTTIDIRKCQNITGVDSSNDIIKNVEFHPSATVALAAGYSGTVTLYQVDGKTNPKIQSVHFEDFPVHTAHFSADGNELIAGSKNYRHFFSYDMICGKIHKVPLEKGIEQMNVRRFQISPDGRFMVVHGRFGYIHLLSGKTKELIKSLKMNGEVIAITFSKDGNKMYSFGDTGQVYVWDINSKRCMHKFTDEGCQIGTALALSPNDQFLACGSDSGIVNIYDCSDIMLSPNPKPKKAIMNLTTEISRMKFNHSSEMLVMSSSFKQNSLKLVHFPSITVFSNFPTHEKQFSYINSLDISLNSGYLMFGNNRGKVYLYR